MTNKAEATGRPHAGGSDRQRELTILVVDLVGSTGLAEALDPERWRDIVVEYHDICDQAIGRYGGSVGSRAGDGLMAHFGLPRPHEDDVRRAVLAGLALLGGVEQLARRVAERDAVDLNVRVGVHVGEVIITEIGNQRDIVGRAANEAARIEEAGEPGTVTVSDAVHARIASEFDMEEARQVDLRGVAEPLHIHTVIGPSSRQFLRSPVTGLVGRTVEREALSEIWERVSGGGGPCAALLVGEAGLGKSRLGEYVAATAARDGAVRIVIEHRSYDSGVPLHGVGTALNDWFDLDERRADDDVHDTLRGQLAALDVEWTTAFLSKLVGLAEDDADKSAEADPGQLHAQTIDAVRDWLKAVAGDAGLVLIVEDLHWADPSTLVLLDALVTRPLPGLMVVMTARPDFEAAWAATAVETLALGPLNEDEIISWCTSVGDKTGLTEEHVSQIVSRSDGVPLYIERLFDVACRKDVFWEQGIPDGLDQLLTSVVEAPGVDVRMVGVLATIGRQFDVEFAAQVLDESEDLIGPQLEMLCELGVLDHRPETATYEFHHAMVQTAAYEHQLSSAQRRAHAAVAAAMETLGHRRQFDAATIARHLDLGERGDEAIRHYLGASKVAFGFGANVEARRHAERGIELVETLPPSASRDRLELDLQLRLSVCLTATEGYASTTAAHCAERAHELVKTNPDPVGLLYSLTQLYSFFTVRGDRDRAGEVIQEMRGAARNEGFEWFAVDQMEALHFYALGRFKASRKLYEGVIEFLEHSHEAPVDQELLATDALVTAYIQMAPICWLMGDREAASDWISKALKRSGEMEGPQAAFCEAYSLSWLTFLHQASGEFDDALEAASKGSELAQRKGLAMWSGLLGVHELICRARLEPNPAFDPVFAMVIEATKARGVASMAPLFMTEHAILKSATGSHDEAVELLSEAIAVAEANGELHHQAETYRLRGKARTKADHDPAEACDDLLTAAAIATDQGAAVYALRALVDVADLIHPDVLQRSITEDLTELLEQVATPDEYPEARRARAILLDQTDT